MNTHEPTTFASNPPVAPTPPAQGSNRTTLLVLGGAALAAAGLAAGLMLRPAPTMVAPATGFASPPAVSAQNQPAPAAQTAPLASSVAPVATAPAAVVAVQPVAPQPQLQTQSTAHVETRPAHIPASTSTHTHTKASTQQPQRVSRENRDERVRTASAEPAPWREPTRRVAACSNCGVVEGVRAVQIPAQPSGLGAVAGGVVGGLLGNQVGGGNGRKAMTVIGAVGGGFAGNEIEKRTRAQTSYDVRVRMEDGTIRTLRQDTAPTPGSRVRVDGDTLRSASGGEDAPGYVRTGQTY